MKLENNNRRHYLKLLKLPKKELRKLEMGLLKPNPQPLTPKEKELKGRIVLDWDTMLDIDRGEEPNKLKGK